MDVRIGALEAKAQLTHLPMGPRRTIDSPSPSDR